MLQFTSQTPDTPSHSRGAFRPGFASRFALFDIEGAGKTGCPHAPMGFRAKHCAKARSHRNRRNHTGLPCAVVYGLYALSWVNLAGCHPRRPRCAWHRGRLDAKPLGRRDHTISLVRDRRARQSAPLRPPQPRLARRDDRDAPLLLEAGWEEAYSDFTKLQVHRLWQIGTTGNLRMAAMRSMAANSKVSSSP